MFQSHKWRNCPTNWCHFHAYSSFEIKCKCQIMSIWRHSIRASLSISTYDSTLYYECAIYNSFSSLSAFAMWRQRCLANQTCAILHLLLFRNMRPDANRGEWVGRSTRYGVAPGDDAARRLPTATYYSSDNAQDRTNSRYCIPSLQQWDSEGNPVGIMVSAKFEPYEPIECPFMPKQLQSFHSGFPLQGESSS